MEVPTRDDALLGLVILNNAELVGNVGRFHMKTLVTVALYNYIPPKMYKTNTGG